MSGDRIPALGAAVVLTATLIVACSPGTIRLTEEDELSLIRTQVGARLEVELPSNRNTEFTWVVVETDGLLAKAGDADFDPSSSQAGAGGTETLTFDVIAEGEGSLRLEYRPRNRIAGDVALATYRIGLTVSE
jgi:predicted secreted protein